jgi:hypothetical protein
MINGGTVFAKMFPFDRANQRGFGFHLRDILLSILWQQHGQGPDDPENNQGQGQ